jgi:PAS domain S-box-containing protein
MEQTQVVGASRAWALRAAGRVQRNHPRTPADPQDSALAAIVRSSQDAVIAKTLAGVVTEWNDGAAQVYGHVPEMMIGRNIEEMIPPESLARERERHDRVAAGSSESGIHCTRMRVDGTPIDVVMSMSPVRDRRGQVVGMASISRPVSDDERSNARFRFLLEAAPDAIVCVDRSGRIAIVNAQAGLIFGYSREEMIGSPVESLVPEHARGGHVAHREQFTAAPRQRPMGAGLSLSARRKDGSVFPVEVSLSGSQEGRDGEDSLVVAAVRDVSAQRAIESAMRDAVDAAQAANEAKNQFLSRMSHELRTPLNAVLGFGQLLSRQLADTEYSEAIGHIVKGGRHLLDLINDVLDIARIESGDMSISSEPVPIAAIVGETLQLMKPLADAAEVALSLSADPSDDYVLADRQRLRQILLNLLSNAIKYNRPGGHVWLGWHAGNGQVALGVRDDGPGIDPRLQNRLFTPFDRLGAEFSGVDGTGIGLALTRSLTEMMGGSIAVESSPGQGSTFTVILKSAQAHRPSRVHNAGAPTAEKDAAELAPVTLLYIEDNAPNVRVVEHLLRLRPEWTLVHAALGSLGIELAEAHQPDLILLDLHLPDLSGHQVLRAIRSSPSTAQTPVVVLTADASAGLAHRLRDSGATGYLTKPLDIDQVLEFLDGVSRRNADTVT